MRRASLPDSLTLPTGEVLKPVIGGHLDLKPFLTIVDVTKNGWLTDLPTSEEKAIITQAKRQKLKYRRVQVLSRYLQGKIDLHHRPYTPTVWIFVQTNQTPPSKQDTTN